VVGRDVVLAPHEHSERHIRQPRQQLLDPGTNVGAPPLALALIPPGAEVAREHASVRQLLRCEATLGRDHERLEQPLLHRGAVEEVSILPLDREPWDKRRRIHAGRDDDRLRLELVG